MFHVGLNDGGAGAIIQHFEAESRRALEISHRFHSTPFHVTIQRIRNGPLPPPPPPPPIPTHGRKGRRRQAAPPEPGAQCHLSPAVGGNSPDPVTSPVPGDDNRPPQGLNASRSAEREGGGQPGGSDESREDERRRIKAGRKRNI